MTDTNAHPDFDVTNQKLVIIRMLEQSKIAANLEIQQLITDTQQQLKDGSIASMKEAVRLTNLLVAKLENLKDAKPTLKFLREHGLYRMLYRYAKLKGEQLPEDDVLNVLLQNGFVGVGISTLFIAAFVTVMLVGAPAWIVAISSGLFVGSSVYLSGLAYGVVNDLFATYANLPYFLLGHQPQQKSLIQTNDKIAQGIAWGVAATFGPVIMASILFTVVATVTAFFVPIATFALPVLMLAMPLIAIGAEFFAQEKTKEHAQNPDLNPGSNLYQKIGLRFMSPTPEEKGAWYANSDRNMFGFTKVPLIGLGGLVGLVSLSALSNLLPAVLFTSPLIAVLIPAAVAGVAVLALAGCGAYMYANSNNHYDDRNNLEFDRSAVVYDLYLGEDITYANELLLYKKLGVCNDGSKKDEDINPEHHVSPLKQAGASDSDEPLESSSEDYYSYSHGNPLWEL